jgi:predicted RND superfamily exporter protein
MKQKIVFALLMGAITTGIISFSLITINVGFVNRFLSIWLRSWMAAYLIVIPVILIVGPQVQKLVNKIVKDRNI